MRRTNGACVGLVRRRERQPRRWRRHPGTSITVRRQPAAQQHQPHAELHDPALLEHDGDRVVPDRGAGPRLRRGRRLRGLQSQPSSRNCPPIHVPARGGRCSSATSASTGTAARRPTRCAIATLRGAVPLLPTPTAGIAALAGIGVQNRTRHVERRDARRTCSTTSTTSTTARCGRRSRSGSAPTARTRTARSGCSSRASSAGARRTTSRRTCASRRRATGRTRRTRSRTASTRSTSACCAANGQTAPPAATPPSDVAEQRDAGRRAVRPGTAATSALSLAGTGVVDVMTYWGTPNNTVADPRTLGPALGSGGEAEQRWPSKSCTSHPRQPRPRRPVHPRSAAARRPYVRVVARGRVESTWSFELLDADGETCCTVRLAAVTPVRRLRAGRRAPVPRRRLHRAARRRHRRPAALAATWCCGGATIAAAAHAQGQARQAQI